MVLHGILRPAGAPLPAITADGAAWHRRRHLPVVQVLPGETAWLRVMARCATAVATSNKLELDLPRRGSVIDGEIVAWDKTDKMMTILPFWTELRR